MSIEDNEMEMETVDNSTAIKDIGYDPGSGTLRIAFRSGVTHQFSNVPVDVHKNFMASESKGKHFHQFIRGVFEQQKVT